MEPISLSLSLNPDVEIPPELLPLLMDALAHLEPELTAAADVMSRYQRQNFADQGATFSQPWAPLAESTLRQKERLGYSATALVRTGRLESEIGQSLLMGDDSVSVGVDPEEVPYAAYHQSGTSRMPQRLLVSVTEDEIEDVRAAVQEVIDAIPGLPASAILVSVF